MRHCPAELFIYTEQHFLLDAVADHTNFVSCGRASGPASTFGNRGVRAGMLDGHPGRVGSHRFAGAGRRAPRAGCAGVLYCADDGNGDFATLLGFAFRARRNPAEHKRLIYIATTALLIAAVSRWPFAFVNRKPPVAGFCTYFFLLALVSNDLWSTRKIHRATLWAGAFLIIVQQSCYLIGPTAAWHALASWVQTHAR
jgi:hypothetical protein